MPELFPANMPCGCSRAALLFLASDLEAMYVCDEHNVAVTMLDYVGLDRPPSLRADELIDLSSKASLQAMELMSKGVMAGMAP